MDKQDQAVVPIFLYLGEARPLTELVDFWLHEVDEFHHCRSDLFHDRALVHYQRSLTLQDLLEVAIYRVLDALASQHFYLLQGELRFGVRLFVGLDFEGIVFNETFVVFLPIDQVDLVVVQNFTDFLQI